MGSRYTTSEFARGVSQIVTSIESSGIPVTEEYIARLERTLNNPLFLAIVMDEVMLGKAEIGFEGTPAWDALGSRIMPSFGLTHAELAVSRERLPYLVYGIVQGIEIIYDSNKHNK